MKPIGLPEWKKYVELNSKPIFYVTAYQRYEPVELEGKKYFIDAIVATGLILVELDPGVEEILSKREGRLSSNKRLTPKSIQKKDRFYCEGHKKFEPRSRGKVYGRQSIKDPYRYYCKEYASSNNIEPLPDGWAVARMMAKEKKKKLMKTISNSDE